MLRYANMLSEGMKHRGHTVEVWTPEAKFFKLSNNKELKKWLSYIDQFVIFPCQVRYWLKRCPNNTLFIFTDHALGPWVGLVSKRPSVIHCHDFIAQNSALDICIETKISWTGRIYQTLIRKGFVKGKNFISVSHKTKKDLNSFLTPSISTVVYNGLNPIFQPHDAIDARMEIGKKTGLNLSAGYILHIGGNQWYKNRVGVVEIYEEWRNSTDKSVPLLLVGKEPDFLLQSKHDSSKYKSDIHFITGLDDQFLRIAYCGSLIFLFPSLMEGFGWPIAEAMACGAIVITTNDAPMTEVAGGAAFLISKKPLENKGKKQWLIEAVETLTRVFKLTSAERQKTISLGLENVKRFNLEESLDKIEEVYREIWSPKDV